MFLYFPPILSKTQKPKETSLKSHTEGLEAEKGVGKHRLCRCEARLQGSQLPRPEAASNEGMGLMGDSSEAAAQLLT